MALVAEAYVLQRALFVGLNFLRPIDAVLNRNGYLHIIPVVDRILQHASHVLVLPARARDVEVMQPHPDINLAV